MKKTLILGTVLSGLCMLIIVVTFVGNLISYVKDNKSSNDNACTTTDSRSERITSFPNPPEDFDPLTATDEELKYYGFTERNSDASCKEAIERGMKKVPFTSEKIETRF